MKKLLLFSSVLAIGILMLNACSTGSGSRDDYFGYNRSEAVNQAPDRIAGQDGDTQDEPTWRNPLSASNANDEAVDPDLRAKYIYHYTSPLYVPVIIPWWNAYYGWLGYYSPFVSVYIGHGPFMSSYWAYDWYSPWYDYNPFYGYRWYPHYRHGYHRWYWQPFESHESKPVPFENKRRNWGPSKGEVADITNGKTGGEWKLNRGTRSSQVINGGSQDNSVFKKRNEKNLPDAGSSANEPSKGVFNRNAINRVNSKIVTDYKPVETSPSSASDPGSYNRRSDFNREISRQEGAVKGEAPSSNRNDMPSENNVFKRPNRVTNSTRSDIDPGGQVYRPVKGIETIIKKGDQSESSWSKPGTNSEKSESSSGGIFKALKDLGGDKSESRSSRSSESRESSKPSYSSPSNSGSSSGSSSSGSNRGGGSSSSNSNSNSNSSDRKSVV